MASQFPACYEFSQRYTVPEGAKIGHGETGDVYKCIKRQTGEEFALKIINLKQFTLTKTEKEVKLLELCSQHNYIITLVEHFKTVDHVFMIFEYCRNGTLLDQAKVYTENQSKIIMNQLLEAVRFMHSMDIVHRDVKIDNLMYGTDGNIRVVDFGMATSIDQQQGLTHCLGTPGCMAPEVVNRARIFGKQHPTYGKPCDLWSCGVVLYTLLTGYPPFEGYPTDHSCPHFLEKLRNFYTRIRHGYFDMQVEELKYASNTVKDLITKLMEKDVRKRLTAEQALEHPFFTQTLHSCQ